MPAKDPEKRRATARAWYARTKHQRGPIQVTQRHANRDRRERETRAWYLELKARLVCTRCAENHPACLVFHHSNPALKEVSVAEAVRRGLGRARIVAEIAKCEVLCANCHAKHHAAEGAR